MKTSHRPSWEPRDHRLGIVWIGVFAVCIGLERPCCSAAEFEFALDPNAALAAPAQDQAKPSVAIDRDGRLLVLTYRPLGSGGGRISNAAAQGRSPAFTVYRGQKKIVSGQFRYG